MSKGISFAGVKERWAYLDKASPLYTYIKELVHEGQFVGGKAVEDLEDIIADLHQVKHVVACGAGTHALYLLLMASGIKRGDEVIIPTNTFIATPHAVMIAGKLIRPRCGFSWILSISSLILGPSSS